MELSIKLNKTENNMQYNTIIHTFFHYLEAKMVVISVFILMLTIKMIIGVILVITMKCLLI